MSEINNSSNNKEMNDEFESLKQNWIDANDQAAIDSIVPKIEKLANQGHGESISLLGRIFINLDNKNRDDLRALEYFERAAKMNVPVAFMSLCNMYADKENHEKAFYFAQQGADLGEPECMRCLGIYLIEGKVATKDDLSGLRWIKKAADAGNFYAEQYYANELVSGDIIEADIPKGIEILERLYKDDANDRLAYLLYVAYDKLGKNNNDAASINKGKEFLRISAELGFEGAKNKLAEEKRDDQWKTLKNFTITNGKESYSFFYKTGKVVDIRTETRSHTSSSGYGNQSVSTSHTSWQVIVLNDTDGNKFEVNPDSTLVISTGSNVDVVYVCKGGETTGYPIIMIDKYSGERHKIKTAAAVAELVGNLKQYGFFNSFGCFKVIVIFLGVFALLVMMQTGFVGTTIIPLGIFAYIIYILVHSFISHKNNMSSLDEHIESIARFLTQK